MKILINRNNEVIEKCETINSQPNAPSNWVLDENRVAIPKTFVKEIIDGVTLPDNFKIGLYKYENGNFIEIADRIEALKQIGYDKAVYDIYFGGNE